MPAGSELERLQEQNTGLMHGLREMHNSQVQEDKRLRLVNRRRMEEMIRQDKLAYERWQEYQEEQANKGGAVAGLFQGAATGASVGSMFKPGLGTAIGAGVGALGGLIFGATQGRQAVSEVAPYAGAVSQVAGGIAGVRAQKDRTQKLIDFYDRQAQAREGQGMSYDQMSQGIEAPYDLGTPGPLSAPPSGGPAWDYGGAELAPKSGTTGTDELSQLRMLDSRRQNPLSRRYDPTVA